MIICSLIISTSSIAPMLYKDALGMIEYVSQGLHDAAKRPVLLYSPGTDSFLAYLTRMELEDRYSIRQKARRLLDST